MDIIHVLRDEHQQVLDLFDRFESLTEDPSRKAVAEELLQLLMIHEEAEEDAVYNHVRDALPDPSPIDLALQEQTALKLRIRDLVADPSMDTLVSRLLLLREQVLDHVATEQNMIFPLMRQVLDDARRDQLAANFKRAKAGHMTEFPSLSITMAPEQPSEKPRRR
jgi:hemerythrin superfamily protein